MSFGFVRYPRVASIGVGLLVFLRKFLAGALIPIKSSSGLLGQLSTYSIDLARNIFSAGKHFRTRRSRALGPISPERRSR